MAWAFFSLLCDMNLHFDEQNLAKDLFGVNMFPHVGHVLVAGVLDDGADGGVRPGRATSWLTGVGVGFVDDDVDGGVDDDERPWPNSTAAIRERACSTKMGFRSQPI